VIVVMDTVTFIVNAATVIVNAVTFILDYVTVIVVTVKLSQWKSKSSDTVTLNTVILLQWILEGSRYVIETAVIPVIP